MLGLVGAVSHTIYHISQSSSFLERFDELGTRGNEERHTRIVKMGKNAGMLNGSIFQYWIARLSSNCASLAFAGTCQGGVFPSYKILISAHIFEHLGSIVEM